MSVLELAARVSRRELLRSLGYPRAKAPAPHVLARIEALEPLAASLLEARGSFCLVERAAAEAAGMPEPSVEVGLGLATIGPRLEAEAQRRSEAGEALDALILDAYGSAAAEAAADALDRALCAAVSVRGLAPARRISPGYGRFPLAGQPALLAALPARELGVELSPGLMMIPRKSVSFAVRLLPGEPGARPRSRRCEGCALDPCPYRASADGSEEDDDE